MNVEALSSSLTLTTKALDAIEESMAEAVIENDMVRTKSIRNNIVFSFSRVDMVPSLSKRELIKLMGFKKRGLVSSFILGLFINWLKTQTRDQLTEQGYEQDVIEFLAKDYLI